ncbi:MAG TPA: alpha-E domain-containing protein [Anaeromyxobacteraceae bacterium]|nr:alpha-E domain-containing protein [Anaeromyxobacteraceae bacterium]
MISRVADHCFWLGRYLERAECTARVLQVTRNLALDAGLTPRQCWQPVIVVSGQEANFLARHGTGLEDGEVVQRYVTWDEENLASIMRSTAAARENARSIREVVSLETWEALNELYLWMAGEDGRVRYAADRHDFFWQVRRACLLALGFIQGTMLHDDPYRFIALGVMLERAGQTARLLDVQHHALARLATHQVETALFLALLRACSGFEPFMKRNRGPVTPLSVASFLVLDPEFPRSIRFSITAAYRRLSSLLAVDAVGRPGIECLEKLRALDEWIVQQRPAALETGFIHACLTRVVDDSAEICDAIGRELLGQAASPAPGGRTQ